MCSVERLRSNCWAKDEAVDTLQMSFFYKLVVYGVCEGKKEEVGSLISLTSFLALFGS